ncbi:MAG: hypothetical protein LC105_11350 [Chitinophagales bacterium]|nr:hypothetical protein [Chitinophagales bacterium]
MYRFFYLTLLGVCLQYSSFAQKATNISFSNTPAIEIYINHKSVLSDRSIAWNPHSFTYYIAGADSLFSHIESFDAIGNYISEITFQAKFKGIWYNASLDFLEAYNVTNNSCVSFLLSDNGDFVSDDLDIDLSDFQEIGTSVFPIYNSEREVYVYFEPIAKNIIEVEPFSGDISRYIPISMQVEKNHIVEDQILYTDIKEAPYAIINKFNKSILLINNEGQISQEVVWPKVNFEPLSFSWTNGALWLLDGQTLTWKAYAVQ